MKISLFLILFTLDFLSVAKPNQESNLYLEFDPAEKISVSKSFYIQEVLISKNPRKYKKTVEDEYSYFLGSKFEFPLKFVTKNKCFYYLSDYKTLKTKGLKPIKWIKESKIIKDGYYNTLPFKHIYICEKLGPNTYTVTEVDMWIGSN